MAMFVSPPSELADSEESSEPHDDKTTKAATTNDRRSFLTLDLLVMVFEHSQRTMRTREKV